MKYVIRVPMTQRTILFIVHIGPKRLLARRSRTSQLHIDLLVKNAVAKKDSRLVYS